MCVNVIRGRATAVLWNVATLAQKRCYQFQLSSRIQTVWSVVDADLAMHSIDAAAAQSFGTGLSTFSSSVPSGIESCFKFTPEQIAACGNQPGIAGLVANKTARGEFFYGIEITGKTNGTPTCLDFNGFLPVLPTFISIVWLSHYYKVQPIGKVETMSMIRQLEPYIPAMPHISIYRQSKERIDEFLALNFTNMLAVRGDRIDEHQDYCYCHQLVEHARRVRGADISIAVPGHPQGIFGAESASEAINMSIKYLKKKFDKGADFIITQICYEPEVIVEYVRKVRDAGIEAPIMVGMIVPDSFKSFELIEMISKIPMPPEMRAKAEQYKDDDAESRAFFVRMAVRIIRTILDANLGVHGIQFYTMNRYGPVQDVLCELRKLNILKEPPPKDTCGNN